MHHPVLGRQPLFDLRRRAWSEQRVQFIKGRSHDMGLGRLLVVGPSCIRKAMAVVLILPCPGKKK